MVGESSTLPPDAPGEHMQGWKACWELFHALDSDIQKTSEVIAQRRAGQVRRLDVDALESGRKFEAVAALIRDHDKPLVRIADDDDDDEEFSLLDLGELEHDQNKSGARTLRSKDLELVRAELRAAAHSSNLRALEFSGSGGQHALGMHDLIVGIGGGVPTGLKGPNGNGKSSTCQAAIETLLWFGLALGDAKDGTKPSEAQQQELAQLEADATQDLSAWDWEAAACQVGFDDTSGGADGAGAVGDAAVAAGGAAATPGHVALAVSGVEHGVARQHSVDSVLSVVTEDAHSPTRPGVAAAYRSDSQSREVSPGAPSPAEGEGRALGRGGRVRKPVRQWESSAPLLKWEKEAMGQKVREKRPRAEPRAAPAGGAPYLYEATYQSDGDYYGDYYGSSGNPLGLGGVDMSALSELEPLGSSADDAAKRRRTWMTGF